MYKNGISQFLPFVVTILMIVITNLLYGIIAGLVVSIFFIIKSSYDNALYSDFTETDEGERNRIVIEFGEVVSFFNKGHLHKKLDSIEENTYVIIDGKNTKHIDYDIIDMLEDYKINAKSKNIELELKNISIKDNAI